MEAVALGGNAAPSESSYFDMPAGDMNEGSDDLPF